MAASVAAPEETQPLDLLLLVLLAAVLDMQQPVTHILIGQLLEIVGAR
jgi:hypothetical protein